MHEVGKEEVGVPTGVQLLAFNSPGDPLAACMGAIV